MSEDYKKDEESVDQNHSIFKNTIRFRNTTKKERFELVKEYLDSGISAGDFAKKEGMGYSTLKKWAKEYMLENNLPYKCRKNYKARSPKKELTQSNKNLFKGLQVSNTENHSQATIIKIPDHIEIVVNNNIKLRMPGNTDINYLIQIIKGLSQ